MKKSKSTVFGIRINPKLKKEILKLKKESGLTWDQFTQDMLKPDRLRRKENMKEQTVVISGRVYPETRKEVQKLLKRNNLTWEDFFQLILDSQITRRKTRWLLTILQEKLKQSSRATDLEDDKYVPIFLFLKKDIAQKIQEQTKYPGATFESVIESLVNGIKIEINPIEDQDLEKLVERVSKKITTQTVPLESSKLPDQESQESSQISSIPSPDLTIQQSSLGDQHSSDIAHWSKQPLIKIPTLEDVRIHLIEKKTVEETSDIRKRYRTYFCEVEPDDLLKPYWLELYIEKLEEPAKSENEVISKIDPEGFKFVKIGYNSYEELEKAMGEVGELLIRLEKGELK